MRITQVGEGLLRAELDVTKARMTPDGYLHAAAVVGLADTAAGFACIAHLPGGASSFTTIELKCNFIGTATNGIVECTANAAHLGRTSQVWDATVKAAGAESDPSPCSAAPSSSSGRARRSAPRHDRAGEASFDNGAMIRRGADHRRCSLPTFYSRICDA